MSEYAEFIDVDDESMTYTMDYAQYAQVGQCHNLGDEVRELRAKVEVQKGTIEYWRGYAEVLNEYLADIFCLYGWGGDEGTTTKDKVGRVVRDIQALRVRARELKGQYKADEQLLAPIRDAFDLWEPENQYPMVPIETWVQHVLLPTWEKSK